jgi:hypothetical protein
MTEAMIKSSRGEIFIPRTRLSIPGVEPIFTENSIISSLMAKD